MSLLKNIASETGSILNGNQVNSVNSSTVSDLKSDNLNATKEIADAISKSNGGVEADIIVPIQNNSQMKLKTKDPEVIKSFIGQSGQTSSASSVKTALPKGHVYLEDYAKGLFGDNYQAHMSGLAKTFGIDNYKEENVSNYNIDPRSQKGNKALGEYLNGFDGYNIDYLDKYNTKGTVLGGITTIDSKGVTTDAVTRGLDDISNKYIQNGVNLIEENAYSTNANTVFNEIVKKNRNQIDENLVYDFRKMQDTVRGYLGDVTQLANDNGYSQAYGAEGSEFVNSYGKNNYMYGRATGRADILNYTVDDKGNVSRISKINNDIDYLAEATGDLDYTDAKNAFAEKFSGTTDDYYKSLKDGDITDSSIKKLIDLKNAGMDIGESGEKILEGYAYTHKAGYGTDKSVINNLSNAAQQQIKKYDNISDENLAYLKEGGLQLEYTDGKFGISQQSIDLMTDDEKKKYQKLIDSNDVGKENLGEIGGALDRRYRENKVLESIQSNYKNKNTIQKTVEEVTEIEKVTDPGYYIYESVTSKVQGDDIGIDINSYGYSPSGKLNKRINPGNEKIVRNSEMYDSDYNIKVTSGIRNADVSEILKENPDITLEELKAQTDPVWINQNTNINPYNIENNRVAKDNINLYKGEDNFNPDFSVNAYVNGPSQTITTMQIVENVEPTIVKDKVTTSKTVDEVTDIFADAPNSFNDIREGASSNYDRITKSYATEDYKGYSLTDDEVLNKSGVTDEKLRKEILGAEKFDDLSPEAMGALYGANTKLSQRDINLGNFELNNKEIASIEKMNPELGKKLRNISAGDKAQILGRTQEEVSNYLGLDKDGLTSKLEMKRNASLDINDPKVARKVLEDLSNKNPEEALADLIDFTGNRKGYGDLKGGGQANKVLDAFRAGTLERDLRSGRLEQAYGIVRDTIDEIKSIHGKDFAKEYDQFDVKTNSMKDKFSVENMKKQAKNFEKADYDRIDAAFDKGLEATAKRMENLSGPLTRKSGNLGKAFDFFGSGKGKATLGLVGGMAAIFGVASIAGNAAEERERKRQEMNQLIAAQNANIRSGY